MGLRQPAPDAAASRAAAGSRRHRRGAMFAVSASVVLSASVAVSVWVTSGFFPASAQETVPDLGTSAAPGPVATRSPVDFDTDVMPLLTRFGCNAGRCHGAADGRGGFRLSLFGGDPQADYEAIAYELQGRRIHLVEPTRSLLLRKATETMGHGGGERFVEGSEAYAIASAWIGQGAERSPDRELVDFTVVPDSAWLRAAGQRIGVRAAARFDDGSIRDVTRWSLFEANDPEAVEIVDDSSGVEIAVRRPGEFDIMVRYVDRVATVRVALPFRDETPGSGESRMAGGRPTPGQDRTGTLAGRIDDALEAKLRRLGLSLAPRAGDEAFLRRVSLDLVGRIPSPEEVEAFTADRSPEKRRLLIDRLLGSPGFADLWSLKWAKVLRVDRDRLQPAGAAAFHDWLRRRFLSDAPYDRSVWEMLTAEGDSHAVGPANFSRIGAGPSGMAGYVSETLMGVRLRCAECHDHPLDHWRQDDYHALAAIFARLDQGRFVSDSGRGQVTHPATGRPALPRIPGRVDDAHDVDRREFADWLTDPDNPMLARSTVNRVWAQLMGRGLVEPVDDHRDTNPASHPDLLDQLARHFIDGGFRMKSLIREICLSEAYQRSSEASAGTSDDPRFYSRFTPRPLEAEVLADAVASATGVSMEWGNGIDSAVRLTDNRVPSLALDILGRCDRTAGCESASGGSGKLARQLHFLNGDLLNRPLASGQGFLTELLRSGRDDRQVLDRIYLRILSRRPAERERSHWLVELPWEVPGPREVPGPPPDPGERRAFFEDLAWALMTSDFFLTNR